MTREEFIARFPQASESAIRANCSDGLAPHAKHQSDSRDESVATPARAGANPTKCLVRLTSLRLRQLDERNLSDKYFTDALRYAGILFDDSPAWCKVEVEQVQVSHKWQERTIITIKPIREP